MREGVEPLEPSGGQVTYPQSVKTAGVIWIIFGCLILLNAAVNLWVTMSQAALRGGPAPAGLGAVVIGALFGAVFIHVGNQSTKGTARDTLGNGIGSLVFALLNGAYGVMLVMVGLAGMAIGAPMAIVVLAVGGVGILAGVGLLAAGVLALVGRAEYIAWRRAHKSAKARRGSLTSGPG
jgi:hypothetical protein